MVTCLEATLIHRGQADTRKDDILAHKSKHRCSIRATYFICRYAVIHDIVHVTTQTVTAPLFKHFVPITLIEQSLDNLVIYCF